MSKTRPIFIILGICILVFLAWGMSIVGAIYRDTHDSISNKHYILPESYRIADSPGMWDFDDIRFESNDVISFNCLDKRFQYNLVTVEFKEEPISGVRQAATRGPFRSTLQSDYSVEPPQISNYNYPGKSESGMIDASAIKDKKLSIGASLDKNISWIGQGRQNYAWDGSYTYMRVHFNDGTIESLFVQDPKRQVTSGDGVGDAIANGQDIVYEKSDGLYFFSYDKARQEQINKVPHSKISLTY